jgi:hypothetical protein
MGAYFRSFFGVLEFLERESNQLEQHSSDCVAFRETAFASLSDPELVVMVLIAAVVQRENPPIQLSISTAIAKSCFHHSRLALRKETSDSLSLLWTRLDCPE